MNPDAYDDYPDIFRPKIDTKVEISYHETPVPKSKIRITQAEYNLITDTQVKGITAIKFIRAQYDTTLCAASSIVDNARASSVNP
jgi:hypothetical protein